MRVSVVTVCFNSEKTITETIKSVRSQRYNEVQHIIKDGFSTDNTLSLIKEQNKDNSIKLISNKDKGIYDAMNIGLKEANGEIVCFLNSDDRFTNPTVLDKVVDAFKNNKSDYVYGNIEMVNFKRQIKRIWRSPEIKKGIFFSQLPHPAFFAKKNVLDDLSPAFDEKYEIAADLKQQLMICGNVNLKSTYIDSSLASMTLGGKSTRNLKSIIFGWHESRKAFNEVNGSGGLIFVFMKVLKKIFQIRL